MWQMFSKNTDLKLSQFTFDLRLSQFILDLEYTTGPGLSDVFLSFSLSTDPNCNSIFFCCYVMFFNSEIKDKVQTGDQK